MRGSIERNSPRRKRFVTSVLRGPTRRQWAAHRQQRPRAMRTACRPFARLPMCGLFSVSAHAVHEGATVHLLGRDQIVYVTEKPDSLHRVHVRSRESLDVIELEPAGLAALAAVVAHELAVPLGALVHRALDRVRDVA